MAIEPVDCAVKGCDEDATLGMTVRLGGLRVELYLCESHFDALDAEEWPPTKDSSRRLGSGR